MRILIVEDEHMIAHSLKKGLTQEGFAVDSVFTGPEGMIMAMDPVYDVIILDRMLPELDGLQICTKLRQQNIHTPILLLTAKTQLEDKVAGLNAGADDYLTKPFSFEELLARVRALSRRPPQVVKPVLSIADLKLDTTTLSVTRNHQQITLHAREFALLEYLLRHQGEVCTKDQIIDRVWDYDSAVLANTVEVYIKNLRKKIDDPFPDEPKLIHTVRGFGYRLGIG